MRKDLAEKIKEALTRCGKTLSVAESCTGGKIAATLTSVSGASDYFQGGLVAYQDAVKVRFLGVKQADIEQYDVVSRQVVEQMVRGACELFHTDYALASTGYAEGSHHGIASGTIWIAWGSRDEVHSSVLTTDRGREWNTENAVEQVLQEFLSSLSAT